MYCFLLFILPIIAGSLASVIHLGPCTLVASAPCNASLLQFYLYTRANSEIGELVPGPRWRKPPVFLRERENKVIVHGYNADMNLEPLVAIKDEYLKNRDMNVWMINWAELAVGPCYPAAVYNIEFVGRCLADFVTSLRDVEPTLDLHVVGFSLGAHVSAVAARYLKPYVIPRVTGLDPAMPLFVGQNSNHKLSVEDASFVDVIHTNALVQGLIERLGHADFYMNGGITQPGCFSQSNPLNCDHHRAPEYFAESINSKEGFYGWNCSSLLSYITGFCPEEGFPTLMGEHVSNQTRGLFIVKTSGKSPYAMGKFQPVKASLII